MQDQDIRQVPAVILSIAMQLWSKTKEKKKGAKSIAHPAAHDPNGLKKFYLPEEPALDEFGPAKKVAKALGTI